MEPTGVAIMVPLDSESPPRLEVRLLAHDAVAATSCTLPSASVMIQWRVSSFAGTCPSLRRVMV